MANFPALHYQITRLISRVMKLIVLLPKARPEIHRNYLSYLANNADFREHSDLQ